MANGAKTATGRAKQYHDHHPMRVGGVMPHDMDGDGFIEYLILQAMTEENYWVNVEVGETQALDFEENGIPLATSSLTDDQKGWAKMEHYDHYIKEMARWRVNSDNIKVHPYHSVRMIRERGFRDHCDDGEEAVLKLWGYGWDLRPLHQCNKCGEVIIKPPRKYGDNLHKETTNEQDTQARALDAGDQAA